MAEDMSHIIQLTDEQRQLIERIGVHHEKSGLPPAPSRILALLLVSPQVELTFDEIRETLNLSKSATSNALHMLMNLNRIEYLTKPGDRKRYFKNTLENWKEQAKASFKKFTEASELLDEALQQRPKETADFNKNLKDVVDLLKFLETELPALFAKWENNR